MGGLCSKTSAKGTSITTAAASNFNFTSVSGSAKVREFSDLKVAEEANQKVEFQDSVVFQTSNANAADDFYDGIPRYSSFRSRSTRSKVSEVSSRIGRAGTVGLGKAVEVLDNLGSSMTNLNASGGFSSGLVTKGNELSILAFEVANTIVKGSNLMQSLSKQSIRRLKEEVLPSEGVQNLISKDMDELFLGIVAADKREELKIFLGEVIRFGNFCKDFQWHNLDRYFEKIGRELTPQNQLKEEAESVIDLLMTSVQYTAELYHELQVLDRIEQSYVRKCKGEDNSGSMYKGDGLAILKSEIKSQRKQVRNLKKKSLWSRSMEEVMEKLVDIVHFLLLEIHITFHTPDGSIRGKGSMSSHQRLGPAGLSLHYANIVLQIDNLVARSSSIPPNARDNLYMSLPPSLKSALRTKLHTFHVKEELMISDIKDEMEKTLCWLVPISANTAKAHHGFGWVGEWANSGSEMNRKSTALPADIMRIETLHHADKDKTESCILDLLLWLHHLVIKSKNATLKSQVQKPDKSSHQQPEQASPNRSPLTTQEQEMLEDVRHKKRIKGISKSQDFDCDKARLIKHDRLSKSNSHHSSRRSKEFVAIKRLHSAIPIINLGIDKEKALDAIDGVDVVR